MNVRNTLLFSLLAAHLAFAIPAAAQQPPGARRRDGAVPGAAQRAAAEPRNPYGTASARVKDLVRIFGADENQLKGLGLVVGLKGTGDSQEAIRKALASSIMKLDHYQISEQEIVSKNVAIVAVTAEIPPFQEAGTRIDVRIASLFDAKDLTGGTLLLTPLRGPAPIHAGEPATETVYATAQGAIFTGAGGPASAASLLRGAIVQRTIPQTIYLKGIFSDPPYVILSLAAPDFNVAAAIANVIRQDELTIVSRPGLTAEDAPLLNAYPLDSGAVCVEFPSEFRGRRDAATGRVSNLDVLSEMIAKILEKPVVIAFGTEPEALVVINERSKTVAVSGRVIIAPGAVYKGTSFKIEVPPAPATPASGGEPAPGPSGRVPPPSSGGMFLTDILDLADLGGAKPEEVIDMVRAFNRAGLIFGRVIVE